MKVTVKVKDFHIEQGTRGSTHSCPIALALEEIILPDIFPSVGSTNGFITFCDEKEDNNSPLPRIVKMPDEATGFVAIFDRGGEVRPFAFELDIPAELLY